MNDQARPSDRALDVLFYAPLGLILNAEEMLPGLVRKGRQHVDAARLFGELALRQGQTETVKVVGRLHRQAVATIAQLGGLLTGGGGGPGAVDPDGSRRHPGSLVDDEGVVADGPWPTVRQAAPVPPTEVPAAVSLAIPDYESLAASQVVPRLAGLSEDELEAVRVYESAHRGRKTILNRVAQLQPS